MNGDIQIASSAEIGFISGANTITFTLPFCPPSVNSLYTVNYKEPDPSRRVTLKEECRRWKSEVHSRVPRFRIAEDSVVRIDWTVHYPWLTKRKSWAKRDTANMMKLLHDAIAEKLGVDDRRFKSGMMDSVNAQVERTVVTLTEVPVSEWGKAQ